MQRQANDLVCSQSVRQLAEQIVVGNVPFPFEQDPEQTLRLANAVRELRRVQLMEWLAGEVARSIMRDQAKRPS